MRPLLLDLFCGAGGAAMGYHRAGFDVVGVDIDPQPHYPFSFIQGDALAPPVRLDAFDAIHASPPCQAYAAGSHNRASHPDLVAPTRDLLNRSRLPWVMENVPGAPLASPMMLCGSSFDLEIEWGGETWQLRRHRLFESNLLLLGVGPCSHKGRTMGVYGDLARNPRVTRPDRSSGTWRAGIETARDLLKTYWISESRELQNAIPPAYTEHIGRQLLEAVKK